jgi:hypothetical protein
MSARTISEAVAVLGVLAGLLFVGVEIRQNTAVARAEARRDLADQNIEFLMQLLLNDDLNELWSNDWTEEWYTGLDAAAQRRVDDSAIALILRLENAYLQYEESLLGIEALDGYGMTQPKSSQWAFRRMWDLLAPRRDQDFVAYFESINGY